MTRTLTIEALRSIVVLTIAAAVGFGLMVAMFQFGAFGGMSILFYRGLVVIGVATLLLAAVLLLLAARAWLPVSTAIAAAAFSFSASLSFLIVLPVTVDRSITVFLLSHMADKGTADFTPADLDGYFRQVYLGDWSQIQRRMDEQTASGNVVETRPGAYRLTPQGQRFVNFSRDVAAAFKTDPRFVAPDTSSSEKPE